LENSCSNGACIVGISRTASGELLQKNIPSAAIPMPKKMKIIPFWLNLKTKNGPCVSIRINDKASPSIIGKRGFDLSPAALKALTGIVSKHWSGQLFLCKVKSEEI
jgi:hypothetical protein